MSQVCVISTYAKGRLSQGATRNAQMHLSIFEFKNKIFEFYTKVIKSYLLPFVNYIKV